MKTLYFAYGSCMDDKDFRRTVPNARLVGAAILLDYRLDFSVFSAVRNGGAADILATPGSVVEGVLWEIDTLTKLDAREGHPYVYKRTSVDVISLDSAEYLPAITYIAGGKDKPTAPKPDYLNLMIEGAAAVGISEDYIESFRDRANDLPEGSVVYPYRAKKKSTYVTGTRSITTGSSVSAGSYQPVRQWGEFWDKYDASGTRPEDVVGSRFFEDAPEQSRNLADWDDQLASDIVGTDDILVGEVLDDEEWVDATIDDALDDESNPAFEQARQDYYEDVPMALSEPPRPSVPVVRVKPQVLFQKPKIEGLEK